MPQAVESHGTSRAFILDLRPLCKDEALQMTDRLVGGHIVRHQQLAAPLRAFQLFPQSNGNRPVDRDCPDFAAFALDGNGIFPQGLFSCGGVDTEALMDAQARIPGQV